MYNQWVKFRSACFLLCLVASFAHAQQRPEPSPLTAREAVEPAAANWMKSHLVPFETDVPTSEELKPLLAKLSSARLIGLGESTHGDHQSQVFKSHVIRHLIADQGMDQVVFEINRSAGQALDDYVNQGKGDFSDVIRKGGVFKIWQTDDFASLIGWIRGYVKQTGKPVQIYGIDCQLPGTDLKVVVSFLRKVEPALATRTSKTYQSLFDSEKEGKTYLAWLKSRSKTDYPVFAGPAKNLQEVLKENRTKWSKVKGYEEAEYAAQTAFQAFNAFEKEFGPNPLDFSKPDPAYLCRRDRYMAQNLLQRIGNRRACLWAHDGHVLGELPAELVKLGYATLGYQLKSALKSDYLTVGFTWSTGVIHAKTTGTNKPNLVALQKSAIPQTPVNANRKGDLGEFLGRFGFDHFYIDFRDADEATKKWGEISYYRPEIGWLFDQAKFLTDPDDASPTIPSHDILVYSRRVSPSTLWTFP